MAIFIFVFLGIFLLSFNCLVFENVEQKGLKSLKSEVSLFIKKNLTFFKSTINRNENNYITKIIISMKL